METNSYDFGVYKVDLYIHDSGWNIDLKGHYYVIEDEAFKITSGIVIGALLSLFIRLLLPGLIGRIFLAIGLIISLIFPFIYFRYKENKFYQLNGQPEILESNRFVLREINDSDTNVIGPISGLALLRSMEEEYLDKLSTASPQEIEGSKRSNQFDAMKDKYQRNNLPISLCQIYVALTVDNRICPLISVSKIENKNIDLTKLVIDLFKYFGKRLELSIASGLEIKVSEGAVLVPISKFTI